MVVVACGTVLGRTQLKKGRQENHAVQTETSAEKGAAATQTSAALNALYACARAWTRGSRTSCSSPPPSMTTNATRPQMRSKCEEK